MTHYTNAAAGTQSTKQHCSHPISSHDLYFDSSENRVSRWPRDLEC